MKSPSEKELPTVLLLRFILCDVQSCKLFLCFISDVLGLDAQKPGFVTVLCLLLYIKYMLHICLNINSFIVSSVEQKYEYMTQDSRE